MRCMSRPSKASSGWLPAGAQVIGKTIQRIATPNFYLGQGKVESLKDELSSAGATLMLFDESLTPVQGVKLEKSLGVRVMDRTEVILDIFATRARSHEAKLQVELAQLEYLLPRLTRMWTHLSRIRGGIGLRGPGETQLETDRRVIRRKISMLKKRLKDVAEHRANQRQGRRDIPTAALVGYTNTGKSSLLRALSGQDVFIEDRLFATVDTWRAKWTWGRLSLSADGHRRVHSQAAPSSRGLVPRDFGRS
jgi:GTP-binding protein HflX